MGIIVGSKKAFFEQTLSLKRSKCGPWRRGVPASYSSLASSLQVCWQHLTRPRCICSGVSTCFAVKLFKSWLSEKDIGSVAASLRKVGMDNRLMVRMTRQIKKPNPA